MMIADATTPGEVPKEPIALHFCEVDDLFEQERYQGGRALHANVRSVRGDDGKSMQDRRFVFKICPRAAWDAAVTAGVYAGSPDDTRDGFIHLSSGDQLQGTAAKHFLGQKDLLLVTFAANDLGAALRWEPSRGGALFPHLYGTLDPNAARTLRPLALDAAGVPIIPGVIDPC